MGMYTLSFLSGVCRILGLFALACVFNVVSAELILTAPPREKPSAGENLYGPLAQHLSDLLGEPVVYKHPNNWLEYQRDVRKDVYDIVFDGPHFVSWRLEHINHQVLVKLPGTLEFVIIINEDDPYTKNINDLIGKKVCGIPPPNLATLTVIEQFKNPVRQPVIWGVPGGFMNVFRSFANKKCRAAVFRANFYDKKLTPQDKAGLKVLFRSKPLPNQAISVSQRVKEVQQKKIIRSLTVGDGKIAAEKISKRFAGNKSFIVANKKEYNSHNLLLEGVVFGW